MTGAAVPSEGLPSSPEHEARVTRFTLPRCLKTIFRSARDPVPGEGASWVGHEAGLGLSWALTIGPLGP